MVIKGRRCKQVNQMLVVASSTESVLSAFLFVAVVRWCALSQFTVQLVDPCGAISHGERSLSLTRCTDKLADPGIRRSDIKSRVVYSFRDQSCADAPG